ncbi:enolase-phosphatase E1-like [Prorops nasuta]|uniref:enolase-phosphatase E1-like n=1 Tax=Prorops nasuta TaxID=863751 RepID=UPI0034CDB016
MNLALHGFLLQVFLSIFDFQHGFWLCSAGEPGYLDFDNLPETNFSCQGKVIGGYYADVEAGCQMFHVCTIGQKDEIMDIKFLCLNGTVFDQETRVCERVDEVDCSKSERFYNLNLELYGNNAVTLSLHEGIEEDEEFSESLDDNQQRTTSVRPTTTTTAAPSTTSRPSKHSTVSSGGSYQHPTGYPQHYQPQPPFPQVHTSQSKSLYDDKNGGYHHQYIFHNGDRNNNQATSYQLFSSQGVSSTTIQTPQVHQVRFSSTSQPQIIHNEPSTVSPLYHSSSTIQTLLNSNANSPNLINPIFHNHGIASTTEQFVHSNNPRDTSDYRDEEGEEDHEENLRRLEPVQSTNQGKLSKLTISPVPMQQDTSRGVHAKNSESSQRILSKPSSASSSSSSSSSTTTSSTQVTHHIHVPPPVSIPQLKPHQITINLSPPDIQRIVQNPSPLLPSQSRVIVTAKASVSDESGRPLNTTQLVTLPLPTIPASYDDYKEGDESFDPFYRDVPKIRSNLRIIKSTSRPGKRSRRRRSRIPELDLENRKRSRRSPSDQIILESTDTNSGTNTDGVKNETKVKFFLGEERVSKVNAKDPEVSEQVPVENAKIAIAKSISDLGALATKHLGLDRDREIGERRGRMGRRIHSKTKKPDGVRKSDVNLSDDAFSESHEGESSKRLTDVSEIQGDVIPNVGRTEEVGIGKRLDRVRVNEPFESDRELRPLRRRKGARRKTPRKRVFETNNDEERKEDTKNNEDNDTIDMFENKTNILDVEREKKVLEGLDQLGYKKDTGGSVIFQSNEKNVKEPQKHAETDVSEFEHSITLYEDEKQQYETVNNESTIDVQTAIKEDVEFLETVELDQSNESTTVSGEEESTEREEKVEDFGSVESIEETSLGRDAETESEDLSSEKPHNDKPRKDSKPQIEGLDSGLLSEEVTESEEYATTSNEDSSEPSEEYHDAEDTEDTQEPTTEREVIDREDTTVSAEVSEESETSREVSDSTEEIDSISIPEEDSTEGVLKFTDEIPRTERKDYSEEMKDTYDSGADYSEEYVDDNYEPDSYKQSESSTNSGDLQKKKRRKDESGYKQKDNKRKHNDFSDHEVLRNEEEDKLEEPEIMLKGDISHSDKQLSSSSTSTTTTSTSTTTTTTTTTVMPTTTRQKLFKPHSIRKTYVFIPPATTPVPVLIKPRLSLLHPKPAKPPKSYNELAPKPVIRKRPLIARKTTTVSTTAVDELELTTVESVKATEIGTSDENKLESKLDAKNLPDDSTGDSSIRKSQALLRNYPESSIKQQDIISTPTGSLSDQSTFVSSTTNMPADHTILETTSTPTVFTSGSPDTSGTSTESPEDSTEETELPEVSEETKEEPPEVARTEEHGGTESRRDSSSAFEMAEETTEKFSSKVETAEEDLRGKLGEEYSADIASTSSPITKLLTTLSTLEDPTTLTNVESTTVKIVDRKYSTNRKQLGFNCLEKEMYRFYGDSRDCRLFHYCSPGFTPRQVLDFRFVCEKGTAFDEDTQSCRHEIHNRKCVNNKLW